MSEESCLFARILRNFTIPGNLLLNDLFLRILLHLAILILIGSPGNVIVIAGPTIHYWADWSNIDKSANRAISGL